MKRINGRSHETLLRLRRRNFDCAVDITDGEPAHLRLRLPPALAEKVIALITA